MLATIKTVAWIMHLWHVNLHHHSAKCSYGSAITFIDRADGRPETLIGQILVMSSSRNARLAFSRSEIPQVQGRNGEDGAHYEWMFLAHRGYSSTPGANLFSSVCQASTCRVCIMMEKLEVPAIQAQYVVPQTCRIVDLRRDTRN